MQSILGNSGHEASSSNGSILKSLILSKRTMPPSDAASNVTGIAVNDAKKAESPGHVETPRDMNMGTEQPKG